MTSPIPDDYNPIAQSARTVNDWHTRNLSKSYFISANFILFPAITIVLIIASMIYYNDLAIDNRMEKIRRCLKNDYKKEYLKWDLQNEMYLSVTFVIYVLALSASAFIFSTETEKHLDVEIKKIVSLDPKEQNVTQLRMITALPLITLGIDLLIAIGMAVIVSLATIQCVSNKVKSTKIILVSLTFIFVVVSVVSSGCITYGIIKKSTWAIPGYAFFGFCTFGQLVIICKCVQCYEHNESSDLYVSVWRSCAYSFMFPLCCIANHLNYIIIAFIHDLYHATSVAIAYGVVILAL